MNLTLAGRSPTPASCGHWVRASETCPRSGPANPTIDRYVTTVRPRPDESQSAAFGRVRARLLAYDIFPPALIRFAICPEGQVRVAATIVQRFQFGLFALEAAVRVIDVWERQEGDLREAGFYYITLQGHPECGIASFRVQQDQDGVVTVVMEARSRAGLLLTRLTRPIARVFQRKGTQAALRRLVEN